MSRLGTDKWSALSVAALVSATGAGCAAKVAYVPGTRIPYSDSNKSVLEAVEDYRLAVERGDAADLMLMAHKQYWEDSGTPTGSDDYGGGGRRGGRRARRRGAGGGRGARRGM